MSAKTENILIQIGIAIAAALFFIPGIGSVHLFDWDEINFAESAREMITSGNYLTVQINFEQFWEKPPLFIWMQVVSMKLFGINEFAARIPDAICGIITLLVLYNIGSKINNKNKHEESIIYRYFNFLRVISGDRKYFFSRRV